MNINVMENVKSKKCMIQNVFYVETASITANKM